MPKAYSLDLRERVARFVEGGRSCHVAAAHFNVSVSFVVRLMKSFRAQHRRVGRRRACQGSFWKARHYENWGIFIFGEN
jgi:transposase